jgi:hypothetical protein
MARPRQCICVSLNDISKFNLTQRALDIIPFASNYICVKKIKNLFFHKIVIDKMVPDLRSTTYPLSVHLQIANLDKFTNSNLTLAFTDEQWLIIASKKVDIADF